MIRLYKNSYSNPVYNQDSYSDPILKTRQYTNNGYHPTFIRAGQLAWLDCRRTVMGIGTPALPRQYQHYGFAGAGNAAVNEKTCVCGTAQSRGMFS